MAESFKYGNGVWATKTGSSMAYNDQNDNYKPLPFSVTRDSIATRVNKQGLIEVVGQDKLRIDYKDSSNGVALLEPSRTNSITHSNDFSQSIYGKINLTITANQGISPDGTQNANLLVPNAAVGNRYLSNSTGSNLKTNTVFLKKKELRYVNVGNAASVVLVDLENGTISASSVGSNNFTIENYGNGWYRVSCYNTSSTSYQIQIFFGVDGSGSNIATNGTDGVYIYGFEIQNGSYPTSYIPTSGSTAQRQSDVANGAGNEQVFNDSEGVLFADIAALADDGTNRQTSINDDSTSDRVMINLHSTSNQIQGYVVDGFVEQADLRYTVNNTTLPNKIALKYKVNDCALWVNGFEVDTDTVATMPSGLQKFNFDSGSGSADFYGKTKEIGYYDTALTDAELEYLTSYRSLNELVTELNLNTL